MRITKSVGLAALTLAGELFSTAPIAAAKPHGVPMPGFAVSAPQGALFEGRSKRGHGDRGLHRGWSHSRHWGARRR